jgi:hypothetical protein
MTGTWTTTVVTMFFDLKRMSDASPSTRPMDFYVKNGVTTLKLPYPMVIFCDEETRPYLEAIREAEVPGTVAPTAYVVKRLEHYDYYQHSWPIIAANRLARGGPVDDRNTASYFLLTMFKALALLIAHQRADFGTPYFAWVDLGCGHMCRKVAEYAPAMLERPYDAIACCYIHYRGHDELVIMEEYMRYGGPCGIAATAFTVPATMVVRFYTAMFQIFYEKLGRGVGHTEETVMAYVYDRHPEWFVLFYGDYASIFTNYHVPREDVFSVVHFFIQQAEQKKRLDLAQTAARALLAAASPEVDEFRPYLQGLLQRGSGKVVSSFRGPLRKF